MQFNAVKKQICYRVKLSVNTKIVLVQSRIKFSYKYSVIK